MKYRIRIRQNDIQIVHGHAVDLGYNTNGFVYLQFTQVHPDGIYTVTEVTTGMVVDKDINSVRKAVERARRKIKRYIQGHGTVKWKDYLRKQAMPKINRCLVCKEHVSLTMLKDDDRYLALIDCDNCDIGVQSRSKHIKRAINTAVKKWNAQNPETPEP